MEESELGGSLYTIMSEGPLNNQRTHTTEEKYDYTISDYVSQNVGMIIGETMKCLSCYQNKCPKLLKDDSFIMPLGGK